MSCDQRIELDAVLVAHLYPVRIPELQSSGDIPDSHQAGDYLLVHDVFDIPTVDFDTVAENVLVCFRGTDVRLHPSGHRLGAEHEVGNFLVHKLDKPGIYLFRVGHGECLDIDLVLNAGNHHLVLCRVGYLVSQPLAVGVALADRLSVDNPAVRKYREKFT